jgi:very-short-patch-repair endonuclease
VTTTVWRTPRPPLRLHQSLAITDEDRALREGIPVTALPRTLLDLSRTVGHRGHGRLRKAIALYRPTSFTRSGLEKRFLELWLETGLPRPQTNFAVEGFEVDCYWPEFRFGVELDVFETHGSRAAFERDRWRQGELLLTGIGMTRVTGPRLEREPEEVIRRVALLLEQRGMNRRR